MSSPESTASSYFELILVLIIFLMFVLGWSNTIENFQYERLDHIINDCSVSEQVNKKVILSCRSTSSGDYYLKDMDIKTYKGYQERYREIELDNANDILNDFKKCKKYERDYYYQYFLCENDTLKKISKKEYDNAIQTIDFYDEK
ncbi:hypothetical protein [Providencia rettgeri]|uniref:hypothetical protein n=1 Tax=Providencia rettgeri TaxID=587 RepID=UPI0024B8CCCF|nr:hypothetical protein [Providencia rettgeri]WHT81946.1 hypothetical protein KOL65_21735 [Providencia rettgeri]